MVPLWYVHIQLIIKRVQIILQERLEINKVNQMVNK